MMYQLIDALIGNIKDQILIIEYISDQQEML